MIGEFCHERESCSMKLPESTFDFFTAENPKKCDDFHHSLNQIFVGEVQLNKLVVGIYPKNRSF